MKATFIEATGFTKAISDFLPDHAYAKVQQRLMVNPDEGDVMPVVAVYAKFAPPTPSVAKANGAGHE